MRGRCRQEKGRGCPFLRRNKGRNLKGNEGIMKKPDQLRDDFPILKRQIDGKPLIYLDSAATSQKPEKVLQAVTDFYLNYCSNIGRGVYALAEEATQLYEDARRGVADFINACPAEIIFTQGCTEGINFIATAWGNAHISAGDEIVTTEIEHHSNLIPWQQLAQRKNATLRIIKVDPKTGMLDLENLDKYISSKTKIVAVSQSSNAIGTQVDVSKIIEAAHDKGALVLVDAAQSAPQNRVDVKELGCDMCVFSGHKMCGPTGIGVLYVNDIVQDTLPPYQFGGGMIREVHLYESFWREAPARYEAGTPPIAQAVGLNAAIDYLNNNVDWHEMHKHEAKLCSYCIDKIQSIPKVHIIGPVEQLKQEGHLVSFVVDGMHPHDIAAYMGQFNICVRAGNQCAQPLYEALGLHGAVRASFYCYTTFDEIDKLSSILEEAIKNLPSR